MKNVILCLSFVFALAGGAAAQTTTATTAKAAQSEAVVQSIRQIDILNQILPLGIRKEQFNGILTAMEKARQKEKKIRELEDDDLEKIAPDVKGAVKDATEKGKFPDHDMQVRVLKLLNAMAIRRQVAVSEMVQDFVDATANIFDAGQKKVMENSLDKAALDPTVKPAEMSDDQKLKFFVKKVFMDSTAYDLLLKLQKIAS